MSLTNGQRIKGNQKNDSLSENINKEIEIIKRNEIEIQKVKTAIIDVHKNTGRKRNVGNLKTG